MSRSLAREDRQHLHTSTPLYILLFILDYSHASVGYGIIGFRFILSCIAFALVVFGVLAFERSEMFIVLFY